MTWEGTRVVLATPAGPLALRSRSSAPQRVQRHGGRRRRSPPRRAPATVAAGIAAAGTIPGRLEPIPERARAHCFRGLRPHPGRDGPGSLDPAGVDGGTARHRVRLRGEPGPGKRPEMGRVAALRSGRRRGDLRQPADEDPGAILAEIVPGLTSEGLVEADGPVAWAEGFFRVEADRKAAIAWRSPGTAGGHGGDRRERT